MINKVNKNAVRKQRHVRVRGKITGTASQPRFNVYRSTNNIYVQIIDDVAGNTLANCSSLDKAIVAQVEGKNKKDVAFIVGQEVAKRAIAKGIEKVVFDRGGYIYTGRVKSLADGARDAGLKF